MCSQLCIGRIDRFDTIHKSRISLTLIASAVSCIWTRTYIHMPVSTHFSSFTPSTRISSPRLSFTLFGRPVAVTESGKGGAKRDGVGVPQPSGLCSARVGVSNMFPNHWTWSYRVQVRTCDALLMYVSSGPVHTSTCTHGSWSYISGRVT